MPRLSRSPSSRALIAATGTAEVRVRPDRATILVGVRATSAASSQEAAQDVARIERDVLAAAERIGVPRDRVSTLWFDAGRERQYVKGHHHPGEFYVDHTYEIEVHDVERVGAAIGEFRAAGATRIAGVRFWLSDEEEHRGRATRQAIARARSRAEEMADAAGVRLGTLVRLGTPEALAATLGVGAGEDGPVRRTLMDSLPARSPEQDVGEPGFTVLPEPVAIEVVVHGAWEVA